MHPEIKKQCHTRKQQDEGGVQAEVVGGKEQEDSVLSMALHACTLHGGVNIV